MSAAPGFTVLFSDDYLVVVAKDAGLLTTPAYGGACLVDLLEAHLDRERFGRHRLAVIHRLDRETSGLLVFSRSPRVTARLAAQFAGHRVEREYVAVVAGALATDSGTICEPLEGKRAVTHFTVLARRDDATTLAVRLETGRRNQIRRHFAARGHPVIGDTRFDALRAPHPAWPLTRIALHARVLGFQHPITKEVLRFEAPVPPPFAVFGGE